MRAFDKQIFGRRNNAREMEKEHFSLVMSIEETTIHSLSIDKK